MSKFFTLQYFTSLLSLSYNPLYPLNASAPLNAFFLDFLLLLLVQVKHTRNDFKLGFIHEKEHANVVFPAWITLLSLIFPVLSIIRKLHLICFYVIFSCITEQPFTFHSSLEELLRFEFFAIVNMAAMNMDVQGSQKQIPPEAGPEVV